MSVTRSRLEYGTVMCYLHKEKNIKIQRVATKMVPKLRYLIYEERWERLVLPTWEKTRDEIAVYKVMKLMKTSYLHETVLL